MKKNNYLEGLKFGIGILTIFAVIGIVTAIGFHTTSEILPGTFSGNYNFINSKIGIGTTNPTYKLELYGDLLAGDTDHNYIKINSLGNSTDYKEAGFWLKQDSKMWGIYMDDSSKNAGGNAGDLIFASGSWNTRLTLQEGGNVGIGTKKPISKLQIGNATDGYVDYLQIDTKSGVPASEDCNSDSERGRMILDYTNDLIYVCDGAARGWDHLVLNN